MELHSLPANLQFSLAALPQMTAVDALKASAQVIGPWQFDHVQICPQNTGALDDEQISHLLKLAPRSRFRLHANVRLPGIGLARIDASSDPTDLSTRAYWEALTVAHRSLGCGAYTLHSGRRQNADFTRIQRNVLDLENKLGCPVGVEGLYPCDRESYLISTWEEYRQLLDSPLRYAVDLSHLHILKCQSGHVDLPLVCDLLANPNCIEVHLSANNGSHDSHISLAQSPKIWWMSLLAHVNPTAVLFHEGVERMHPGRPRPSMTMPPTNARQSNPGV